jgi:NAD(P)H dehydrogenase (quinone)
MKVFLVHWHPEPSSFNGALFRAARASLAGAGHDVQVSDLRAMRFDPVSGRHNFKAAHDERYFKQQLEELYATDTDGFAEPIETEIAKLEWCDVMIWQFPLWWFGLPAALKGWVDRVFAMGRIYGNGRVYADGVFRGKRAMLSLTTGGPREAYVDGGFNGNIDGVLRPIQRGILAFTGFDVLRPHIVYAPARLGDDKRREALAAWSRRLTGLHSEAAIDVGQY